MTEKSKLSKETVNNLTEVRNRLTLAKSTLRLLAADYDSECKFGSALGRVNDSVNRIDEALIFLRGA